MAKLPERRRRCCPLPAQDVEPWTAEGRFEPATESTQRVVLTWDDLPPEFSFVIAGVQTGPRRGWWEPPPGTALEVSWVLYPDDVPPALRPLIVLTGALALYRVLDDLRLAPTLHWPSQLRIGDRIVGGVRTDARDLDGPVALGAGVYVGLSRHEIPAGHRGRITSVAIVGSRADRMEIFVRFQDHLRASTVSSRRTLRWCWPPTAPPAPRWGAGCGSSPTAHLWRACRRPRSRRQPGPGHRRPAHGPRRRRRSAAGPHRPARLRPDPGHVRPVGLGRGLHPAAPAGPHGGPLRARAHGATSSSGGS